MSDLTKFSFSIIKHRGDLNHAETAEGYKVHRKDRIYFRDHGWIKCAPYDNHFIYDDPFSYNKVGRWSPMCTCGSPAGIVGYNDYIHNASPTSKFDSTIPGELIICLHHAQYGKHADGSS